MQNLEKLAKYDALVWIHPDFWPLNQPGGLDSDTLLDFTDFMLRKNKPVFYFPSYHQKLPSSVSEEWFPIPSDSHNCCSIGNHQAEIDFMARIIGKPPKDISIATGGLYSSVCVIGWSKAWCDQVECFFVGNSTQTDTSRIVSGEQQVRERFRYGEIFNELTEWGKRRSFLTHYLLANSQTQPF